MRIGAPLALALLAATPTSAAIDPFHLAVERDARAAMLRGAPAEAARLYRVACFGMLDEPVRLGGCTVRLALAQHQAGDREGFRDSWSRLATVEERFQGLSRAEVDDAERRELAGAARAWLAEEQVRSIPALAALAPLDDDESAKEATRRPPASSSPPEPPPAVVVASSESPPEANPAPESVPAPPPATGPTDAQLARLEAARELLAGQPTREELEGAIATVRPIADAWPADAGHARLVGDLAYRAALWPLCAEYYRRAGTPGLGEPLERFYMAICLYETGARGEAAELLTPIAPRLRATPFVASYLERILGASSLP